MNTDDLEKLIMHEARYFEIWSHVTRTASVWFLDSVTLPNYQSANRALHLRLPAEEINSEKIKETDKIEANKIEANKIGQIEKIVGEVIAHYVKRGLPVVVDVDPIAESLGFGSALRRQGVMPVADSTLLMRYTGEVPPEEPERAFRGDADLMVTCLPNETGRGEAREWIALAGCDEKNAQEAAFWRAVAALEARAPECRLYLARVDGQAAGTCQLFSANGWAQIDSVMTHPTFRRRGIASRLVSLAVRDSFALGNTTTYLFTDNGGAGERVYRKLGFEAWGVNLLRRHLLW